MPHQSPTTSARPEVDADFRGRGGRRVVALFLTRWFHDPLIFPMTTPSFLSRRPFILAALLCASAAIAPLRAADAPTPKATPAPNPALAPIVDVPGLPRVLLIGDSISIGYTLPVRAALKGKANVHRPPGNCSSTGYSLTKIDEWLGTGKWDVIHFNFGLHDAKLPPEGVRHAAPADYEKNLRIWIRSEKKLIFRNLSLVFRSP